MDGLRGRKRQGDKSLFSYLRRRVQRGRLCGLGLLPEGIGLACVTREKPQELPRLECCEFRAGSERREALEELARAWALDNTPCIGVMEGDVTTLLLVETPQVDASELKAAVRWRIKDLIDFHIDDAVIDVFDIPGQQDRGRPRMMYVVAARTAVVQEHIELMEGAGARLSVIDIPELAQRNVAALLPEDPSGVALLHLSRRRGLLTLTRQGDLYLARTLDLGVDRLAAELPAETAEPESLSLVAPDAAASLERLFDTVVLEVQRSLDYYESHFSLPPVSGVVLAPTERPVPGLAPHMANNLGVPVRVLDLNALLDCAEPLSDAAQARCLPAIGAALREEERAL